MTTNDWENSLHFYAVQENNLENPRGKKVHWSIPVLEVSCAQVILADDNEGTRHLQDLIKLRIFSLKNNLVIFTNQGNH